MARATAYRGSLSSAWHSIVRSTNWRSLSLFPLEGFFIPRQLFPRPLVHSSNFTWNEKKREITREEIRERESQSPTCSLQNERESIFSILIPYSTRYSIERRNFPILFFRSIFWSLEQEISSSQGGDEGERNVRRWLVLLFSKEMNVQHEPWCEDSHSLSFLDTFAGYIIVHIVHLKHLLSESSCRLSLSTNSGIKTPFLSFISHQKRKK